MRLNSLFMKLVIAAIVKPPERICFTISKTKKKYFVKVKKISKTSFVGGDNPHKAGFAAAGGKEGKEIMLLKPR